MNPQTLKYLQQDDIGKVIAKGLANIYNNKPDRPVKCLAEWLYNYSNNCKQMTKVLQTQKVRQNSQKVYSQNCKLEELQTQQKQRQLSNVSSKIQKFKDLVKNHEYHYELLQETLPQFIEEHTEITGAYIGELNHPPKQITQEDDSELAHLNEGADKLINYIGSSVSHKALMCGKLLPLNQGVTAKAFTLDEEEQPPAEQGQEQVPVQKQKYIYIPNVVKNQAMHYFKIPKLGAYLAVPLVCQSYLTEQIFHTALQAKNKYIGELQQFTSKQKQEQGKIIGDKQEIEKKIKQLKDKNAPQAQIQTQIAELARVQQQLRTCQEQKFDQIIPELTLNKIKFVVCVDNIGKDKQLSKKDIDFIVGLVQHFKECWISKQKQLLTKDVLNHVQLIKSLPQTPEVIHENLNKQTEQIQEEKTQQINQIENQTLKAYKLEGQKFIKLKKLIKDNSIYLKSFLKLKQFRVIKFKNVVQNVLYFLGFCKTDVNEPGKAILNWKQVRQKYITEDIYNKILDYIVQGSKQTQFKSYAKTPALDTLFEGYDEQAIFEYNIGLGVIVKFIKSALKHRISNVELRKDQKQTQRKERDEVIAQNQKIAEQKAKQLEKHKEGLTAEEIQNLNEQEWSAKYDEEHPAKEEPNEIVEDIDNDM